MTAFSRWRWSLSLLLLGASAQAGEPGARQVAHWLRYVAADYGGAVRQGKVINQEEFDEQLALLEKASASLAAHPDLASLNGAVRRVRGLVEARAEATEVGALAQAVAERLLLDADMEPPDMPSLERGRAVFERACASCHGSDGSGRTPLAAQLRPPPADLQDPVRIEALAPRGVALAIEFGIPGTGMVPRADLTPVERWDVAFYAVALAWPETPEEPPGPALSSGELASLQNRELRGVLLAAGATEEQVEPWMGWYWRHLPLVPPSPASLARRSLRRVALLNLVDEAASRAELRRALAAAVPLRQPGSEVERALQSLGSPPTREQLQGAEGALLRADLRAASPRLKRDFPYMPGAALGVALLALGGLLWRWRRRVR